MLYTLNFVWLMLLTKHNTTKITMQLSAAKLKKKCNATTTS